MQLGVSSRECTQLNSSSEQLRGFTPSSSQLTSLYTSSFQLIDTPASSTPARVAQLQLMSPKVAGSYPTCGGVPYADVASQWTLYQPGGLRMQPWTFWSHSQTRFMLRSSLPVQPLLQPHGAAWTHPISSLARPMEQPGRTPSAAQCMCAPAHPSVRSSPPQCCMCRTMCPLLGAKCIQAHVKHVKHVKQALETCGRFCARSFCLNFNFKHSTSSSISATQSAAHPSSILLYML